ncbi:7236_t:CDS:1 [Funneliformis mosseae]|uniref:7236_t:CDS:1 n=1 Tax=Funneliformis mosseae TaxID=27381 RepID=A0A9N9D1F3_FUNMO|nr:7236_t:CDS:1 [Funneliformis mosseae]
MSRPHMKINIKEELDGLYLSTEDNIKEYIVENPSDNHIHTIVKPPPPATTAKYLPMVYPLKFADLLLISLFLCFHFFTFSHKEPPMKKRRPLERGISVIQSNNEVQQFPVSESIMCRQNVLVNSTSVK